MHLYNLCSYICVIICIGILNVTVKSCNDLVNADSGDGGLSDPYVTLQMGEHGTIAKTKRINNNLNPVFNEQHKIAWNGEDPLKVDHIYIYIYIYIHVHICMLANVYVFIL